LTALGVANAKGTATETWQQDAIRVLNEIVKTLEGKVITTDEDGLSLTGMNLARQIPEYETATNAYKDVVDYLETKGISDKYEKEIKKVYDFASDVNSFLNANNEKDARIIIAKLDFHVKNFIGKIIKKEGSNEVTTYQSPRRRFLTPGPRPAPLPVSGLSSLPVSLAGPSSPGPSSSSSNPANAQAPQTPTKPGKSANLPPVTPSPKKPPVDPEVEKSRIYNSDPEFRNQLMLLGHLKDKLPEIDKNLKIRFGLDSLETKYMPEIKAMEKWVLTALNALDQGNEKEFAYNSNIAKERIKILTGNLRKDVDRYKSKKIPEDLFKHNFSEEKFTKHVRELDNKYRYDPKMKGKGLTMYGLQDPVNRLKLLVASKRDGHNDSKKLRNEGMELIDYMLAKKLLTGKQHKEFFSFFAH
jgi:hypothetical protein